MVCTSRPFLKNAPGNLRDCTLKLEQQFYPFGRYWSGWSLPCSSVALNQHLSPAHLGVTVQTTDSKTATRMTLRARTRSVPGFHPLYSATLTHAPQSLLASLHYLLFLSRLQTVSLSTLLTPSSQMQLKPQVLKRTVLPPSEAVTLSHDLYQQIIYTSKAIQTNILSSFSTPYLQFRIEIHIVR